jgi:uncharacterized protein (TIGR02246 family)
MAGLTPKDQADIRKLWTKYEAAFNRQSARAVARLYGAQGDLIGVEGDLVTGPPAIEKYYVERFSKLPGATITDSEMAPARTIAGSGALVNGTWRVLGVGPDPIDVVGTFVVKRERGTWSYFAVRFQTPLAVP